MAPVAVPLLAHVGAEALAGTVAVAAVAVGLLALAGTRRAWPLAVTAVGGLVFQAVHLGEHVVQGAHWVANPTAPPWLGPWAQVGAETLGGLADGQVSTGTELLHLAGNAVFLAGLGALLVLLRRSALAAKIGPPPAPLLVALWLQASHVLEHVVLTATWAGWGRAVGLSTGFGLLAPGTPVAVGVRLWFHLLVNLAASALVAVGLVQVLRRRRTTLEIAA
jgi:hypothetical protein